MNVPKSIFRQYDIRGLVDSRAHARRSPGRWAGRSPPSRGTGSAARRRIAVGRDNRPSGPALSQGVRLGIADAGGTAVDVGTLPTPALYFAVSALETDGGVQVTGSHNPPEFNGFKMVLAGDAFHGDDILGLWEIITAERWRSGKGKRDHRQLGARSATARRSSSRHQAGAAGQGRRRLRQRRRQRDRRLHASGARRRGDAALLRVGRHLPEPPSRSRPCPENLRGPPGGGAADRRRAGHRASTATPTGSARWTRPARSSGATSSWSSSAATRCGASGPARRSSST